MKISSLVEPYRETEAGSPLSSPRNHFSAFLPTMPGIIKARPMQTALQ
jgi:hypothetical protein